MLARTIPNARFVALESEIHLILSHEPEWRRYLDEVCGFLDEVDESTRAKPMSVPMRSMSLQGRGSERIPRQ